MFRFRSGFLAIGAVGGLLLVAVGGCGSRSAQRAHERPFQGMRLTVAALGNEAILKPVGAERGEWQARQGAEVAIAPSAVDPAHLQGVDVLVFPGEQLGALADRQALAVLPESLVRPRAMAAASSEGEPEEAAAQAPPAVPLAFDDIVPAFRDRVTRYGQHERLALPMGASALVLVYRQDAFDRAENQAAAEQHKLKLQPPQTWEELDALARFFQGRDWNGDGKPESGIAFAQAADTEGLAAAVFLSRAAALGQHPFHYAFLFDSESMEPRIGSAPFVTALEGMVGLAQCGPPGAAGLTSESARAAFRTGKAVFLIDRAERVGQWSDPKQPLKASVVALPGSMRVFEPVRRAWEDVAEANRPSYLMRGGGWLVGVSTSANERQRAAALDFITFLASPDTGRRLLADPSFPMLAYRQSQLGQGLLDPRTAPGIDARQWARAVSQTLTASKVVVGLRIPGAEQYLAELDSARARALKGEPPGRVLADAARAWSKITDRLGRERQLWHYRRSLNALSTAPEPPPRSSDRQAAAR